MLARAPASPAQGLHRHGPRYYNFLYLCMVDGLEKLGRVMSEGCPEGFDAFRFFFKKLIGAKFVRLAAGNAGRGERTTLRVDRGCSRYGVRRFDEPF